MKLPTAALALRPAANFAAPPSIRTLHHPRSYATQNSLGTAPIRPRRQKVTAFNDDGHVPWSELSAGEKTARATQQSFNLGMILVGVVLTGGVGYFMWTEVFSPDSKISQFNRAVDKIKKDPMCLELFGDKKKITAHGEETWNKWRRARPVASSERTDPQGNHHLMMHFHVEGPKGKGVAQLHMVRPRGQDDYEYQYLYVDVRGHERVYLENAETSGGTGKKKLSLFGIKWS